MRQFVGLLQGARAGGGHQRKGVRSPSTPHPAAREELGQRSRVTPRTASCPLFSKPLGRSAEPAPRIPLQPQSEKTFLGNSAHARGWGPRGRGALTLLSSLRFIPRLDLYTWYMWAKSILQGEGPGRVVSLCEPGLQSLAGRNPRMRPELLQVESGAERRAGVEA